MVSLLDLVGTDSLKLGLGATGCGEAVMRGRLFVPNGSLELDHGTVATGTFIARDVDMGSGVEVRKDERAIVRVRKQALDLAPALLADIGAQM